MLAGNPQVGATSHPGTRLQTGRDKSGRNEHRLAVFPACPSFCRSTPARAQFINLMLKNSVGKACPSKIALPLRLKFLLGGNFSYREKGQRYGIMPGSSSGRCSVVKRMARVMSFKSATVHRSSPTNGRGSRGIGPGTRTRVLSQGREGATKRDTTASLPHSCVPRRARKHENFRIKTRFRRWSAEPEGAVEVQCLAKKTGFYEVSSTTLHPRFYFSCARAFKITVFLGEFACFQKLVARTRVQWCRTTAFFSGNTVRCPINTAPLFITGAE